MVCAPATVALLVFFSHSLHCDLATVTKHAGLGHTQSGVLKSQRYMDITRQAGLDFEVSICH